MAYPHRFQLEDTASFPTWLTYFSTAHGSLTIMKSCRHFSPATVPGDLHRGDARFGSETIWNTIVDYEAPMIRKLRRAEESRRGHQMTKTFQAPISQSALCEEMLDSNSAVWSDVTGDGLNCGLSLMALHGWNSWLVRQSAFRYKGGMNRKINEFYYKTSNRSLPGRVLFT